MSVRTPVRLPAQPLEDWLNARYANASGADDVQTNGRLTAQRIAELIDCCRGSVQRWRAGGIPLYSADRAAIRAGAHPLEVWPQFHSVESDNPMSITFYVDHHDLDELRALDSEAAPSLNVCHGNAGQLQHLLGLTPTPCGEIDAGELLERIAAVDERAADPSLARRLHALSNVATAAARPGRDVAWY